MSSGIVPAVATPAGVDIMSNELNTLTAAHTTLVRWFDDIDRSDIDAVGGKGANLGELTRVVAAAAAPCAIRPAP